MKNQFYKKMLAMMLVGIMVLSMVGCGEKNSETPQSNLEMDSDSSVDKDDDKAEDKSVETFTVAMCQSTDIQDWDTNYMTLKLEEEMGVDIEFVMFPGDTTEAKTKLSLMVNAGEVLPDIVVLQLGGGFTLSEVQQYGEAGVFIPLNDYLADSSVTPNYNAIAAQYPEDMKEIKNSTTCSNGNIYSFFEWYPEDWNDTPYRYWMNKTWLDKLGLTVPTTIEEFEDVLEAFSTQDPNGNGKNDEIPFTGSTTIWGGDVAYALMNSFVFTNGALANNGLALGDDGSTVVAPFVTEEWRDGLEYLRGLCDKGLMDPAMFTMDSASFKALVDQETNVVGCFSSGTVNTWSNGVENKNFQDYVLMAPLKGPEGVAYTPAKLNTASCTFYITSSCKNPELAAKIGDWFLAEDNSLSVRYGEEGVNWSVDEKDTSNGTARFESQGYDCTITLLGDEVWGTVHNQMWNGAGPRYMNSSFYRGMNIIGQETLAGCHATSFEYYSDAHPELLPSLTYTLEENEIISEIMVNVNDYVNNQMAAFITGNISMDEWDNYLEELGEMGLQTWLEVAQTAFDRMAE